MKQQIIDAARGERQALLAALEGIDEAKLTTVPVCGTWAARDVLAHVAAVDATVLDALRQARAGKEVVWAWASAPDGDSWNQAQVASRQDRSLAQLRAELEESHQNILTELEAWPEDAGPFGPDSWDPEKSPIGWLPNHDREHAAAFAALRAKGSLGYVRHGFGAARPYLYGHPDLLDLLKGAFGASELERAENARGGAHVELKLGDGVVVVEASTTPPATATRGSVYVYVEDIDAAYRRALESGAKSLNEPADMPYDERAAGVTDSFGNTWWIATYRGAKAK